ncbi:uncharacterized protein LOC136092051 [Hydra vulgaris]|uniref:Uncharacterized protein LOC136092051 n=1 Tax=Hydra vulgaris TaxID=6087 RepID=A0ABM4DMS0_HYDVU
MWNYISKLKAYGINGSILYWIKNFLKNRRQRVNGNYSNWVPVKSGVPQGSVLSALLFIIYVNDIPEVIKSKAALFADDTKIFRSIENTQSAQELQNDIDALVTWSQKWGMKCNIDKCSVMHLGNNNKSHTYNMHDPEINIRVNIKTTNCERDLGVHIDSSLLFSKHTTIQVNKATQIIGIIKRTFTSYPDILSFKKLFSALVRPHLEYCGSICNPGLLKDKRQLENVLSRASKRINGLQDLPYEQRLLALNMTTVKYRLLRADLINVYKWCKNNNSDRSLFEIDSKFITRGHIYKLKKQSSRLNLRMNFFSLGIINKWNSLPNHIVLALSLKTLKLLLDNHLKNEWLLYD